MHERIKLFGSVHSMALRDGLPFSGMKCAVGASPESWPSGPLLDLVIPMEYIIWVSFSSSLNSDILHVLDTLLDFFERPSGRHIPFNINTFLS